MAESSAQADLNTPLQELAGASASLGQWKLKISGPPIEKTYPFDQGRKTGKAFTVVFVSKDSTQYCAGRFTRRGTKAEAEKKYAEAKAKFKANTVWKLTHAQLVKHEKPVYIGCSVKATIDINASKFTPVLQSAEFQSLEPTPAEDLSALLEAPANQRVDITALVTEMSPLRTAMTSEGARVIVDITIRDSSGADNGAAQCKMTLFFPDTPSGRGEVNELQACSTEQQPVAFFNLFIHPTDDGRKAMKPGKEDFRWAPAKMGKKAELLKQTAARLYSTDSVQSITSIEEWTPQEKRDFLAPEATLTVVALLQQVIRNKTFTSGEDQGAAEHLFQLNHVRVREPLPNDDIYAGQGSRLFVPVLLQDHTGQVDLRMREKAALELSGCHEKADFKQDTIDSALNFPMLCSVRVLVRERRPMAHNAQDDMEVNDRASEHAISAVIVEAAEQTMDGPKAFPNESMAFIMSIVKKAGILGMDRRLVAPANMLARSPHGGMVVENLDGQKLPASAVLTCIAHMGKCDVIDLPKGNRITTAKTFLVPFLEGDAARVLAGEMLQDNHKLQAKFIAYCTSKNVQNYTLSSRKPKQPVYAMALVASAHASGEETTFMMDKVHIINEADLAAVCTVLRKMHMLSCSSVGGKREYPPDATPLDAKKSRTLAESPTDASLG